METLSRSAGLARLALLLFLALPALACAGFHTPWRGPGPRTDGAPMVVAVTHAVLNGEHRAAFSEGTRDVLAGIDEADGYLGHTVRRDLRAKEAWTMTLWRDEASLARFVRSPLHRSAIDRGLGSVASARFLRAPWPAGQGWPTWEWALSELASVEPEFYPSPSGADPSPSPSR